LIGGVKWNLVTAKPENRKSELLELCINADSNQKGSTSVLSAYL
jgi:hypothetical protein